MSGRSPTAGRNNRHHYNDDNVESYRQKSRQNNRKQREDYDEEYSSRRDNNNNQDERKKQLALERKQRMARLREEIKKEDETLAALDKKQQVQSNDDNGQTDKISPQETIIEVKPEELEGLDQEEQMRRLLGFNGFGSTKGEAVDDNQSTAARGGAAKNKARKYRQYMNRKSGFNRPLEKMK